MLEFVIHEDIIRKIIIADSIMIVESAGDTDAVGDAGNAVGAFQIWPIMVEDVNRIVGEDRFSLDDRTDYEKSLEMFFIYTDHYTPSWVFEKVARRWNGGPDGDQQNSTERYWEKVQIQLSRWGA